MEFRRFESIAAFEGSASGRHLAFHSRNLQVAVLDAPAWDALQSGAQNAEALGELQSWSDEVDSSVVDADISMRVKSLMINVAQVCNLKCSYCAAGGDGSFGEPTRHVEMETIYEQIRMFMHDLKDGEEFSITFFGGEPLLNPQVIVQLARFARLQAAGRNIALRFCTITNGTLVTPEIAEILAQLHMHVTISIDGPPETNDLARKTRSGRGSSASTLEGLRQLLAVRSRLGSLSAGSVFGRHGTDVLSTYRFLKQFEFDCLKFDFAAEKGDDELSDRYAESLQKTADEAFTSGGERELRRIGLFDTYFRALDEKKRFNNHCGAGKSMLSISSSGAVSTCQWFVGKPEEQVGQGTRLEHEKRAQFQDRLVDLNDCGRCWARFLCGGGCMYVNDLKNGSKHKKDPQFCKRTRTTIAKAIEHYAEARYEETGVGRETY